MGENDTNDTTKITRDFIRDDIASSESLEIFFGVCRRWHVCLLYISLTLQTNT